MYRRGRPRSSAPCSLVLSTTRPTTTPDAALISAPSGCVTLIAAIVIAGSVPPMPGGGVPATLLATIRPVAPAACAFAAFTTKPHVPRSTIAIFPATVAALVNAVQPSVVDGPAAFAASRPTTTLPLKFAGDTG